jgi:hypothetical protein
LSGSRVRRRSASRRATPRCRSPPSPPPFTRLRRYVGEPGVRPLVYDYTEPLLTANEPNRVRIVSDGSTVRWWNNGRLVFNYSDPEPYTSGHFAFRTTWSHFRIEDFQVWRLFNHF